MPSPRPKPSPPAWALPFWAAAHWLVLELLRFGMDLMTRLPLVGPHLDPAVAVLMWVEHVLVWPRRLLRPLWPGDAAPDWWLPLLVVVNSFVFAGLLQLWLRRRARRRAEVGN